MSFESVRAAYGSRVSDYVDVVGRIDQVDQADLELIEDWARGIDGPILDVGCGPGQWTDHLAGLGLDVAEFVEHARRTYTDGRYRVGRAEDLHVEDGALGGVLAWYSLIHVEPDHIGAPLAELARCIRPGGGLALGFFTDSVVAPFDHAVDIAYYWPIDVLVSRVEDAGFTVTHTGSRADRPERTHAEILASRRRERPRGAVAGNGAVVA
ncbi:class I SAM-dependent methyltransferase [Gordonia sp. (in: high G+C Gram-positive bacteria)]|uniref:class I SAM-dependent methyltransferase n=1 Tax=Gordonia sp. (in: high G+C Gram-positive bacteria) TaxID=84139 RepID=UPI0039E5764F